MNPYESPTHCERQEHEVVEVPSLVSFLIFIVLLSLATWQFLDLVFWVRSWFA
jgi:cytochrome oxidase assembly protein ShyY1